MISLGLDVSELRLGDERLPARFWSKVSVNEETGCWEWAASCTPEGYSKFRFGGEAAYGHRVAYEELVGPIPEGLHIDHLCRVRHCVNPAHMEPVTCAENVRRGTSHLRNREKTHCKRGHPFDEENTGRFGPDRKWRYCKTCYRDAGRATKARKRQRG